MKIVEVLNMKGFILYRYCILELYVSYRLHYKPRAQTNRLINFKTAWFYYIHLFWRGGYEMTMSTIIYCIHLNNHYPMMSIYVFYY